MIYMTYFTLKEKIIHADHYCICSWLFVNSNIVYGKALAIVTKRPIVDVARVLNPCQYELTWIGYRNNLIQVLMEGNNWST